jgi:acyl dehydratase
MAMTTKAPSGTSRAPSRSNPFPLIPRACDEVSQRSRAGGEFHGTDHRERRRGRAGAGRAAPGPQRLGRDHAGAGDQWIHVDPERAKKDSPFGGPIAHGYLTLSLLPSLIPQIVEIGGFRMGVNYGTEKVRFPSPVPVGSRLRATTVVDSVTDIAGGVQIQQTVTFQVEGATKPACVATIVVRQYP